MSERALVCAEKRDERGRFIVPPISPGRPKGARNKLGEAFLEDMFADWKENGAAAIKATRETKPEVYLKVVASILPRELNLRVGQFEDMTDDELARELASIASQLAGAGVGAGAGIAAALGDGGRKGKPAKVH